MRAVSMAEEQVLVFATTVEYIGTGDPSIRFWYKPRALESFPGIPSSGK